MFWRELCGDHAQVLGFALQTDCSSGVNQGWLERLIDPYSSQEHLRCRRDMSERGDGLGNLVQKRSGARAVYSTK